MTCQFRCGNQCAHEVANTSANPYFGEVVEQALSRRGALAAGALGALVAGAGVTVAAGPAVAAPGRKGGPGGIRFKPVPPNKDDALRVPEAYRASAAVRWGDPVLPAAPEFDCENRTA